MSAVNEWVVREYFETLGFLVSQPRKYLVPGRAKTADEELDLIVFNPQAVPAPLPDHTIWTTDDVRGITRAVVGVRGWHTERFYASTFEQTPDILRFVEPESVEVAARLLGSEDIVKILCLPRLPASDELQDKMLAALREKGIHGVLSFQTVLLELVRCVEVSRNYEKSDVLQVIRLLKNYDLIKDVQLELFSRKPRRHGGAVAGRPLADSADAEPAGESEDAPRED